MLSTVASAAGFTVPVALRINPDVDAGTHAKITTGRADNKFGIGLGDAAALYARAAGLPGLQPVGLAVHIGSQIGVTAPYRAAFTRVAELVRGLRAAGHAVSRVDCGGGLGISYRDEVEGSPAALAGAVAATLGGLGLELMVEPGRWLAGPAGLLLSSVVLTKTTAGRRFTVLDAAMNDLLRPAMYEAWHAIVPGGAVDAVAAVGETDIVGPVCETGDTFARGRRLPVLAPAGLCGDPRCGCLWFGHELHLQRPPAGGPGDGRWRALGDHPRPAARASAVGRRNHPRLDGGAVRRRDIHARLAGRRAQARRVLWFERVWPALWPVFALVGAWIAAALFDLPARLPGVVASGLARSSRAGFGRPGVAWAAAGAPPHRRGGRPAVGARRPVCGTARW